MEVIKVKFEIELDKVDIGNMNKNRYGHNDVLTKDYMLDILHDIVDQIHDQYRPCWGVWEGSGPLSLDPIMEVKQNGFKNQNRSSESTQV
ncbi:MAG: hypothetical protein CM15mV52_0530 [uncultured marine virus]|nr:MAG: hypothetical protein CM15mV52_0530 [uncultured marine virus]